MANTTEQQQSEKVIAEARDEITGQAFEPAQTAIGDCARVKEGVQPVYYDYIERGKALAEGFKQRERRVETQDEITGQASEPARMAIGDCARVKEGVQPVYYDYIERGKALAEGFKQREPQVQEASREVEQRYQLSKEAIEIAIKVREKAEQDALVAYREELDKAVNKASQVHKDAIEIAIKVREKAEQDALVAYREELDKAVNKASQVYKETVEMAVKVREKAEQDALVASTEEVDKTVDKASQVYKDKMKQAWIDCKQRVMDAWKDSIETSVQMAGVFEQDRNMNTNPSRQPLILNEALVNQSG